MTTVLRKVVFVFGVCFSVLFNPIESLSRPSTIVLKNNGYTNLVVAIHDSIAEDKTLIDKLKDEMTKASKILYVATKQRAYLKEIKILLPSSWSNDASYQTPTSESLALADVIITDPIRRKRSIPQTRSYDGCGKQGVHVLLTKEFLTTPRADPYLNNPAKFFVHAFAQFRWGVFQEYAEEGENVFYMSPSVGQPEAIRCTFFLRGLIQKNDSNHLPCYSHLIADRQHVVASIDDKTGLYDSDCLWRPYPNHQRSKASIMDHQFIQELVTFCGDDPKDYATFHNSEAPSKHNRLCAHKSTWGVITETDDFRGGVNPPTTLSDAQIKPTFTIMRSTSRKRRAALLVHPSLTQEESLSNKIERALDHLRHEVSKTDFDLSIHRGTEGSDMLRLLDEVNGHNLNRVNISSSEHNRFEILFEEALKVLSRCPQEHADEGSTFVEKRTAIHRSVTLILAYLNNRLQNFTLFGTYRVLEKEYMTMFVVKTIGQSKNVEDGGLVILTDTFNEDMKKLLAEKVKRNSGLKVALITGDSNEKINEHHEHFSLHNIGGATGHTLLDRLRNVLLVDHANIVMVWQKEIEVLGSKTVTGTVDIDKTLGKRITFIFHYEEELPVILITSPNGASYRSDSSVYSVDDASKVIMFHFQDIEVGRWMYTISQSTTTPPQNVRVTVISEDLSLHEDPLVLRQSVKFADDTNTSIVLHVDVTQGSDPVLGFNVTAKIEKPDGTIAYLALLDNGAGADTSKDDGIYSRIYIAPKLSGSYHVTFMVSGGSETVVRKEETASVVNDDLNPIRRTVTNIPIEGYIQRQISGGTIFLRYMKNNDIISDVIAPSRITDLRAKANVKFRKSVVLEWTAPGDNHDHGKPELYELVVGCGIRDVRHFLNGLATDDNITQSNVIQEKFEARVNGTEVETFLWNTGGRENPFIFALRAIDEFGNKGNFSNLATA